MPSWERARTLKIRPLFSRLSFLNWLRFRSNYVNLLNQGNQGNLAYWVGQLTIKLFILLNYIWNLDAIKSKSAFVRKNNTYR